MTMIIQTSRYWALTYFLFIVTTDLTMPILEKWKVRLKEVMYFRQGHTCGGGGGDTKGIPSFKTWALYHNPYKTDGRKEPLCFFTVSRRSRTPIPGRNCFSGLSFRDERWGGRGDRRKSWDTTGSKQPIRTQVPSTRMGEPGGIHRESPRASEWKLVSTTPILSPEAVHQALEDAFSLLSPALIPFHVWPKGGCGMRGWIQNCKLIR